METGYMPVIRVLEDTLINQIAAGEVVERPASVVKELVENALDASATRIDVAISEGGLRWICVTDNGIGMSAEDAPLAFQRHATSKLKQLQDLQRIGTLGFRGEALPSIASVSDVRLRTRRAEDSIGTEVSFEPSDAVTTQVSQVACNPGTRVEVAHLFGRIPARRKFMKSPVTESTHITRWLERMALVRPELRLSLERDGKNVLSFLPTAELRERLAAVLPVHVGERLLEFQAQNPIGGVHGFASPTDLTRSHTNDIHVFVNGRAVRDRLLQFAVRHAYRDALPPGRHPIAVVYLEIAPERVDVNVHPAKTEVRFQDPDAVRQLISHAIARALGRATAASAAPYPASALADLASHHAEMPRAPGSEFPPAAPPPAELYASSAGRPHAGSLVRERRAPLDLLLEARAQSRADDSGGEDPPGPSRPSDPVGPWPGRPQLPFARHRVLGQLLSTYLVLERPGELVLLDQHAAHERVLFEQLRDRVWSEKLERQTLLIPIWLELPNSASEALETEREALERVGYELEWAGSSVRGGARVAIKAVPALLTPKPGSRVPTDWASLLEETASVIGDPVEGTSRGGIEAAVHHVMATAACHAATRKGDRLEPEEIRAILEKLDETVWFPNCPHGRPISQTLSERELERRFLRG